MNYAELENKTRDELVDMAKELGISGYSSLRKEELVLRLLQGYTEQSNVSIVEEFINLIVAQRAYEANSKVVKAADDMYQQVNNLSR